MKAFTKFVCIPALAMLVSGCLSINVDEVSVRDEIASTNTGFLSFTTHAEGEEQPSVVYVPDNYDPSREWPLVVFLHGMGERGSDGWRQTEVGIGKAIRWNPDRFPCLVVMPQCSKTTVWSSPTNDNGAPAPSHIDDAIAYVERYFNVDKDRVSLTGLSMGGYGTFAYGANNADRFSAFAPICGGGDTSDATKLAQVPMKVFHGGADTVVAPDRSRVMVEAIRAAGGSVTYTEYPGVGHNSWDDAYGDPETISWLISQRR